MTEARIVLHGLELSGHSHRVELFLRLLDLPYRFSPAPDPVRAGAAFRALNPLGQVPVLEDGEVVLADSNAILVYLAKRYGQGAGWLPEEAVAAARVQRFLSIAAGELRYGPALARVMTVFGAGGDRDACRAIADRVFAYLEGHLAARSWLAADHPTIADIACYSYIAAAPEGGIALDSYQAIKAWLGRVASLPRFKPMPAAPSRDVA